MAGETSADKNALHLVGLEAGQVRVEVLHTLPEARIDLLITRLGGEVQGRVPDTLVEAVVPIDQLVALEAADGVVLVRPPLSVGEPQRSTEQSSYQGLMAIGGAYVGEQVAKTNVDQWHAAGFDGSGIRIGIIDFFHSTYWNAAYAAGEVPGYSGTPFCRLGSTPCDIWASPNNGDHGVAVAEVIHEMAPGALIYVATAETASDLQAAVNHFISQGVDIITRSLTAVYDGPGDGSGPIANVINSAVANGVTWFNSAGNTGGIESADLAKAGSYWRGQWSSPDGDQWLDFAPGDELMPFDCAFLNGVRWDDWPPGSRTDYNIYIYDTQTSQTPIAASEDAQDAALPLEHPDGYRCGSSADRVDWLSIWLFDPGSGTTGDVIEFMTNGTWVGYWTNPYSGTAPASDTKSAGAMSVGAVDPVLGANIAHYSSRGPANDGRTKPDLAAASCMASFTNRDSCFNGTSAATPVAAGAAAVILDSGWVTTPTALKSFILNYMLVERGPAGPDNTYGAGELILTVFVDIPTSPFVGDIEWIAGEGITGGCAAGHYCPKSTVTRGQMAAFLRRAFDLRSTSTDFFDDDDGSMFEGDINALAAAGVTGGCGSRKYCPSQSVTRGQMAAFLRRAFDLPRASTDYFDDDDASIFESDINAMAAAGVTGGCGPRKFCPRVVITREQMAAFLHRALN